MIETYNSTQLRFTITAESHSHYVDFKIYEIESEDPIGWHKKDSRTGPDPVYTLDEAAVYIEGSVKWDGCSNWMFNECKDAMMLHGCTRQHLSNIGIVLALCWSIASELLPNFQGDKE